ncbi:MAG: trypsin-like peptidase domain-containing protein [Gemmataceae bacterium]
MTESEERKMFREAIPIESPPMSDEELEALRRQEGPPSQPESKNESSLAIFGTPTEANIAVSPYQYGGKLFFKGSDGLTYVGSAQFVGEYNIILTAAHCVRDNKTGAFFSNFRFYRAFKNGSYAKLFLVNAWGTKVGWVSDPPNRRYDFAFLRTTDDSDVGYLGYKTFQSENSWNAFGYPHNYGNNQIMQTVNGSRGEVVGGTVQMLGNPMRSGNSGAARFIEVSSNNRQVLGNDAFHKDGDSANEWGPQFDNSTFTLLKAVHDA